MKRRRFEEVGFGKGEGETKRLAFDLNESKRVVSVDFFSFSLSLSFSSFLNILNIYFNFRCCAILYFRIAEAAHVSTPLSLMCLHLTMFLSFLFFGFWAFSVLQGLLSGEWSLDGGIVTFAL